MRNGSIEPVDTLVAKCWDLSDAYKQVPLSDDAFDLDSYLAVFDPNTKPAKIFKQRVLPFGSIASVTALLRVSLNMEERDIPATTFVVRVLERSESRHVDFCVDAIFSPLGWRISKHKLIAFDSLCKVLGVQIDLRQSGHLLCFVSNTEERVEELIKEKMVS